MLESWRVDKLAAQIKIVMNRKASSSHLGHDVLTIQRLFFINYSRYL